MMRGFVIRAYFWLYSRNRKFYFYTGISGLFLASLIALGIYYFTLPDEKNPQCKGKDRWDVKILTDNNAGNINYLPEIISIEKLIAIFPEHSIEDNTPRFGIEFNTYSVKCRIQEYKLSDDGDLHLVLQDVLHPEKTMIAEIPDMYCESVQKSSHLNEFISARKFLQDSEIDTSVYVVTGVAFYDKMHGQLGIAPNGIEIHPVLSIYKK